MTVSIITSATQKGNLQKVSENDTSNNPQALIELQSLKQWVCWCYEPTKNGKMTKVPYQAINGYKASTNNPKTWATYEDAVKAQKFARTTDGKAYDGIGFVFNRDYTGIDWDHCVNEDGTIEEWAKKDIDRIATYCELSPSGTGIHGIARALLPQEIDKEGRPIRPGKKVRVPGQNHPDAAIEMYCEGRFFTMTGKHLAGTPAIIEDRQEEITALFQKLQQLSEKPASQQGETQKPPAQPTDLSDHELIEKACSASNGTKFSALWYGDTSAYGSDDSAADQALCNLLAFWTGKDSARMDRLFRQSGLYRAEKWDRNARSGETYGEGTIERAIASCGEVYKKQKQWTNYTPSQDYSSNGNGHASGSQQSYNLTDLGNAERFAAKYRDKVRWCETWNTWLIFNGKCWEPDRTGRVDHLAKVTVRAIHHEAANPLLDKEEAKKISKHAFASESNRSVRAMLDRAKSELPVTPDEFNKHLYLLNCKNGTLDLRYGELRPHSPYDFLTRCLKIDYNPLATCSKWESFIDSILAGDISLVQFMKESLGMSLCGDTSEQCLFICHGSGSNGKTTMLETVRIIMEDYGLAANIETFSMRKNQGIGNDIAELYGARLVTASENALGSRLNEAFIKKATGKEPLRARRLHENEFQFMPEFTIWFAVNHKPVVKDTSKGMWRRVHFIPFTVTIEGDKLDKHLGEKLLDESEGILAWLVQGHMAWHKRGHLVAPETVQEATKAYRAEMDTIANFIEERCSKSGEVGATKLYQAYKAWCEENGERYEKQKAFGTQLTEHGYERDKVHGVMVYRGLNLISGDDGDDVDDKSKSATQDENTSQKSQNNHPNHPHHPHSEEKPKPPNRNCFKCGMQNWRWDGLIENWFCGGCNHG